MSTSQPQAQETAAERLERELRTLRAEGVLKKELPAVSRSTFEQLSPQSRMDFMRAGGMLVDDPAPAKQPLPEGAIKRSAFDRMAPAAQFDYLRKGGAIVDDAQVAEDAAA